ncbi:MAG: tetratricopeptide repeat protein [Acidimicrobiia bacterium]|nr:tetratricopeptide repeat protein [Acidimicrobiia bacterium]
MVSLWLVAMFLAQAAPDPAAQAQVKWVADNKTAQPQIKPAEPEAPKPALTPEMRGDIAMARKEYRQAIEQYQTVVGRNPIILNKIGIAYHQMTELSQARKYYEQATKANSKYAEAINNLGTVYYAQKNYKKAISYYNRALKITPNSASIYSNLGTAWFARKKYDRASEAYTKALELDPEVFEHRSSNGVLLQERSVAERAKFHFYLARTYAKAGMTDRALLYMRKALEEGFKERKRFVEDPEFAVLQELPEFKELLVLQPRVL